MNHFEFKQGHKSVIIKREEKSYEFSSDKYFFFIYRQIFVTSVEAKGIKNGNYLFN